MAPKVVRLRISTPAGGAGGAPADATTNHGNNLGLLAPPTTRDDAEKAASATGTRTGPGTQAGRRKKPGAQRTPANGGRRSKAKLESKSHATETPSSTFITLKISPDRLRRVVQPLAASSSAVRKPSGNSFLTLRLPNTEAGVGEQTASILPPASGASPPSLVSATASTPSGIEVDWALQTPKFDELSPRVSVREDRARSQVIGSGGIAATIPPAHSCQDQLPQILGSGNGQVVPFGSSLLGHFNRTPGLPGSLGSSTSGNMAPVRDTSAVHLTIKDVIQHLSDIQMQTHGYVPETQDLLVDKMTELAGSLSQLQTLTSTTASPNSYIHSVQIAPEIVDYVDDGRNPDIFTRDFVENVQRGNAVINGKQQAFKSFTEIYAQALKEGIPGVRKQVDRVLENAGFETRHTEGHGASEVPNSTGRPDSS